MCLLLGCAAPDLPGPRSAEEYSGQIPFGNSAHPALLENGLDLNARKGESANETFVSTVASVWFAVYQHTWSRADGPTCRFKPTCSAFAREAIRKHGIKGIALAFARLQRNHSHPEFYGTSPDGRLKNPVEDYE